MTNTPDATPPPELVRQWFAAWESSDNEEMSFAEFAIPSAAQWGAGAELEACCEWLRKDLDAYELVGLRAVYLDHNLYAARRSKPPSLKEEALGGLDQLAVRLTEAGVAVDLDTIRRALEALPND